MEVKILERKGNGIKREERTALCRPFSEKHFVTFIFRQYWMNIYHSLICNPTFKTIFFRMVPINQILTTQKKPTNTTTLTIQQTQSSIKPFHILTYLFVQYTGIYLCRSQSGMPQNLGDRLYGHSITQHYSRSESMSGHMES